VRIGHAAFLARGLSHSRSDRPRRSGVDRPPDRVVPCSHRGAGLSLRLLLASPPCIDDFRRPERHPLSPAGRRGELAAVDHPFEGADMDTEVLRESPLPKYRTRGLRLDDAHEMTPG